MYEMEQDSLGQSDSETGAPEGKAPISAAEKAHVQKIIAKIRADKAHHEKAFKRMKRDMFVATHGCEKGKSEDSYKANVAGRHVRQKTASLYAKNPKAVARRRESMDFAVWDENEQSLMLAFQTIQQATAMMAQTQGMQAIDEFGNPVAAEPQLPPGFEQAQALVADFQQGYARQQQMKKFGRTLEIVFAQSLAEQKPVDFKTGMKQVVRRACTTSVGYAELGYQREFGPRPGMTEKLTDARQRLDHLKKLSAGLAAEEFDETSAEMAELQASIQALQSEPEIVLREGLIFDYPASTKVIPDKLCKHLTGFIGARHLTIEYIYTKQEVEELFGVDLAHCKGYAEPGAQNYNTTVPDDDEDQGRLPLDDRNNADTMVCVWKHYDKPSGLVYFVCDGHPGFLRPAAAPDVFVTDFWPVYALTFNAVENEDELYPPSDVGLLLDMQREYNNSRQGKRDHRRAAKPRWAYSNGAFDAEDVEQLKNLAAFEAAGLNIDPDTDIKKVLMAVPVPGVDPNLYDTGEIMQDMELVVGRSQTNMGGLSKKATATGEAISAGATAASDNSGVDDLDAFLSAIARGAAQILMREMSEEKVRESVGVGAVWPAQTMTQISEELSLEVEAGSSGKPNQAVEINNWERLLPSLMQMGGIQPTWLARETLRRLDDRMDLNEAIVAGLPSIVAQNANAQPSTGDPASDPNAQGAEGGNNSTPPPGGPTGSGAAFGSNQV